MKSRRFWNTKLSVKHNVWYEPKALNLLLFRLFFIYIVCAQYGHPFAMLNIAINLKGASPLCTEVTLWSISKSQARSPWGVEWRKRDYPPAGGVLTACPENRGTETAYEVPIVVFVDFAYAKSYKTNIGIDAAVIGWKRRFLPGEVLSTTGWLRQEVSRRHST